MTIAKSFDDFNCRRDERIFFIGHYSIIRAGWIKQTFVAPVFGMFLILPYRDYREGIKRRKKILRHGDLMFNSSMICWNVFLISLPFSFVGTGRVIVPPEVLILKA
jgi:hypothetical protein